MRVRVDADLCQGHTLCAMTAPALFRLSEVDGHSTVIQELVPEDLEELARRAAAGCPEEAIFLDDATP